MKRTSVLTIAICLAPAAVSHLAGVQRPLSSDPGSRAEGVLVARDFPPFEKTHCRLSFGTMDEMKKAVAVFGDVLGKKVATAA